MNTYQLGEENIHWPRKRPRDQHPWRQNKSEMAHTRLLLLINYLQWVSKEQQFTQQYIYYFHYPWPSYNPGCSVSLIHSCTFMYGMLKVHEVSIQWQGYMSIEVSSPKSLTGLQQNLIMSVNITSHQYISLLSILVKY